MARYIAALLSILCVMGLATRAHGAGLAFNDPFANQQWYLSQLHFNEAWQTLDNLGAVTPVTVAVIDSGFQTDHVDLDNNLTGGINIVDLSNDIGPIHPHGTATAGLPGALSGNNIGISQSALGANVLPIRVSNRNDGAAYLSHIAAGIRYAADHGARVINISYSGVESAQLEAAAAYAASLGAVTFMAAGNDGWKYNEWTNHPHLIAVGASNSAGQIAYFSNKGRFVDLVAPGQSVTTLYPGDDYASWSGTSFSSPTAASVAALMLMANPDLSPAQVQALMKQTASNPSRVYDYRRANIRSKFLRADGDRKARLFAKLVRFREKAQNIREAWGSGLIDASAAVDAALATVGTWSGSISGDTPNLFDPTDLSRYQVAAGGRGDRLLQSMGFLDPTPLATSSIPEPGTLLLLAAAAPLLLPRRRRAAA